LAAVETAQQAAQTLRWQLRVLSASRPAEIDAAFETAKRQGVNALMIGTDPFFRTRLKQIVANATRYAIPTVYFARDFTDGGLISYGNSIQDAYRRAGLQTARLLKGAKPADLPIDRAVKFELVINLKTARALGLDVPPMLLARADEVIE
jgi:putative ABC transport system substrate-binding protein